MKSLYCGDEIPDDEYLFDDGVLYLICAEENGLSVGEIYLNPERDEPLSLAEIALRYPDIEMLIHDDMFSGEVFRYDNYGKKEWTQTGQTRGFA